MFIFDMLKCKMQPDAVIMNTVLKQEGTQTASKMSLGAW